MIRRHVHENLTEGIESARNARRQADQPQEDVLVPVPVSHVW